jgi:hypothetical protein
VEQRLTARSDPPALSGGLSTRATRALEAAVGDALGTAERDHDRRKGAKSLTSDIARDDRVRFRLLAQHRRAWEAECEKRRVNPHLTVN